MDARIDLRHIAVDEAKARVERWLGRASAQLGLDWQQRGIQGAVFEVRQGYKSADSKRQNADLQSGIKAVSEGYLFVVTIFSTQISQPVIRRYRGANLLVLVGSTDGDDTTSTLTFTRDVLGYDLTAFFERNSKRLRVEFLTVLEALLTPV